MKTIILEILNKYDPISIAADDRPDEYAPEAVRIASVFAHSMDLPVFTQAIHTVFVEMFDAVTAGPEERYRPIAEEILRTCG